MKISENYLDKTKNGRYDKRQNERGDFPRFFRNFKKTTKQNRKNRVNTSKQTKNAASSVIDAAPVGKNQLTPKTKRGSIMLNQNQNTVNPSDVHLVNYRAIPYKKTRFNIMANSLGDIFRVFDFLRSNSINLSYSLIGSEVDQLVDYDPRRFDLYRLDNIPQPLRDSNGIFDNERGRYLYDFDLNEIVETFDGDDKREVLGPLALEILDKGLSRVLVRALVYSDQHCNFREFVVPIHSRKEWRELRCKDGIAIDGGDFSIKFPVDQNNVVYYHNDDWEADED